MIAPNLTPQSKADPARLDALPEQLLLGGAVTSLCDDLSSLYITADKIHWYLRLKRDSAPGGYAEGPVEIAREFCDDLLRAIVRVARVRQSMDGDSDCSALLHAVAAAQSENELLS